MPQVQSNERALENSERAQFQSISSHGKMQVAKRSHAEIFQLPAHPKPDLVGHCTESIYRTHLVSPLRSSRHTVSFFFTSTSVTRSFAASSLTLDASESISAFSF